ncbi:MAG: rhodanese-like domain-containing protein [Anaerolineales bacterium]|nr:rhodanese-like domain-containing protein [Anaerolineales bacterium]
MNRKSFILLILISSLFLTACASRFSGQDGSTITSKNSYSNITPEQLNDMFPNKDFLLINVHIPFAGDIPQTDLSIPYDRIDQELSQLPEDKEAKIIVYCRSGSMSSAAAEKLVSLGYTNIINLERGFHGWEEAGFPLE